MGKRRGKTSISNTALQDKSLSFTARGILAYLLSEPDSWQMLMSEIESQTPKEKTVAIRKAVKELQDAGYLTRIAHRDSKGKIASWENKIYEVPGVERNAKKTARRFRVGNSRYGSNSRVAIQGKFDKLCQQMTDEFSNSLAKMAYRDFLKTDYWLITRQYKLSSAGYCCESCGNKKELHVHHNTYEHRGLEYKHLSDLTVLCARCHAIEHGIEA